MGTRGVRALLSSNALHIRFCSIKYDAINFNKMITFEESHQSFRNLSKYTDTFYLLAFFHPDFININAFYDIIVCCCLNGNFIPVNFNFWRSLLN